MKMICPECEKAELESCVYEDEVVHTPSGIYQPFWDFKGVYHHHDRFSDVTVIYRCDNNHKWTAIREKSCPNCDWKG